MRQQVLQSRRGLSGLRLREEQLRPGGRSHPTNLTISAVRLTEHRWNLIRVFIAFTTTASVRRITGCDVPRVCAVQANSRRLCAINRPVISSSIPVMLRRQGVDGGAIGSPFCSGGALALRAISPGG